MQVYIDDLDRQRIAAQGTQRRDHIVAKMAVAA
jgi:hypothetical protein